MGNRTETGKETKKEKRKSDGERERVMGQRQSKRQERVREGKQHRLIDRHKD
jgi:hypothetical protein